MSKSKDKYVKVCPECKSVNVGVDTSTVQQMGIFPTLYVCGNCNYSAHNFPEIQLSKLENFEKDVDKKNLRKLRDD